MQSLRPTILDNISESDYTILVRFVRRYTNSNEEAMDALQEAFRQALDNEDQIRDPTRLMAWLKTTAKREAYSIKSYYAKLIIVSCPYGDNNLVAMEKGADYSFCIKEVFEQIAKVLNNSAPVYGAILRMRYREGRTFVEIADRLNMKSSTIRSYHKRILRRLRKAIASCGFSPLDMV